MATDPILRTTEYHPARAYDSDFGDSDLGSLFSRVMDASQRLISDGFELIRADAEAAVKQRVAGMIGALIGVFVAALGWIALMIGLGIVLSWTIMAAWSFALIGGAHLIVGLVALVWAQSKLRGKGEHFRTREVLGHDGPEHVEQ